RFDGAGEARVAFLQPPGDRLDLLLGRQRGDRLLPRRGSGQRLRLFADAHDLPAVSSDGYELLTHDLAILAGLDFVAAGLQADLLDSRAGDDDLAAVHGHADAGIIDLHHQRAVRREQPDDAAAQVGYAGRIAQRQAGAHEDQCRSGPGPWRTFLWG